MLKTPFKALLVGSQIAVTSLMATTAIAQTTQIENPSGSTVIVPDNALEDEPSGGFVTEGDYPVWKASRTMRRLQRPCQIRGIPIFSSSARARS